MSTELSRLYQSLAMDTEDAMLPAPESVRRRADRRARVRAGLLAAAVAVLVAGTAVGSQIVLAGHGGMPAPADTPTVRPPSPAPSRSAAGTPSPAPGSPTGSPTGSPGRPPKTIPDRAFFALPANTKKGEPTFRGSDNMLPELCAASYPADRSLLARRTRLLIYKLPSSPADPSYVPDGTFHHTITSYPNGVAVEWMAELRSAVRDCPRQTINGFTYRQRLVPGTRYGDDSLLIEVSTPNRDPDGTPTGGDEIRLVSVVRLGTVVTVLYELGYEGTSSDPDLVDDYTRRAVNAIQAWLG